MIMKPAQETTKKVHYTDSRSYLLVLPNRELVRAAHKSQTLNAENCSEELRVTLLAEP